MRKQAGKGRQHTFQLVFCPAMHQGGNHIYVCSVFWGIIPIAYFILKYEGRVLSIHILCILGDILKGRAADLPVVKF